ncbi:hypothetical protein GGF32_006241 [Allomyces javanicus]|nr:hypothetical protein GGF32_006241 [Allomyces javanicus]
MWLQVLVLGLAATVQAHIYIGIPYIRGSPLDPMLNNSAKDYNVMAPISSAAEYPCQGKPPGDVQATMVAGHPFNVTFHSGVTHGGGNCEFSVSYDGKTFVVLDSVLGTCFQNGTTFRIPVPPGIRSADQAVFQWTWINARGNRELYVNCIDVAINGTSNGTVVGPAPVVANLPGYPAIDEITSDRTS